MVSIFTLGNSSLARKITFSDHPKPEEKSEKHKVCHRGANERLVFEVY